MRNDLLARLVTMHSYCRPHGSRAERAFIDRWIAPLGASEDQHGNWHLQVGTAPILWSAHTDTVHRYSGSQKVRLSANGILTSDGSCLGADDTAGCFLLRELAVRGIQGRYVWHYGEEAGCIGSHNLADERPEWIDGIKYAIALDRKGTADVITHQCASRTASDAFALDLAIALADHDLQYMPSDRGLFTDTESYAHLIPECTNLSIGYSDAHGKSESLDTGHVLRLLDALSAIDVTKCSVDRDPAAYDDWYFWRREPVTPIIGRSDRGLYLDPAFDDVQRAIAGDRTDDLFVCPDCEELCAGQQYGSFGLCAYCWAAMLYGRHYA